MMKMMLIMKGRNFTSNLIRSIRKLLKQYILIIVSSIAEKNSEKYVFNKKKQLLLPMLLFLLFVSTSQMYRG